MQLWSYLLFTDDDDLDGDPDAEEDDGMFDSSDLYLIRLAVFFVAHFLLFLLYFFLPQ